MLIHTKIGRLLTSRPQDDVPEIDYTNFATSYVKTAAQHEGVPRSAERSLDAASHGPWLSGGNEPY